MAGERITAGPTGRRGRNTTVLGLMALLLWMATFGVCLSSPAQQGDRAGTRSIEVGTHTQGAGADRGSLTPEEQQWLSGHDGQIRVGITVIPPQVLHGDGGEYEGLSIDYIRLMERKLGCRVKLVPFATWNEVMQAARMRRIDMIFAAQRTPARLTYLLFTEPYIELPNMIVVRKDRQGGDTLQKMRGWSVATSEGSAVHEYLKKEFGYLDLRPVQDELSGLMKVSLGDVDAMVVEISRASYYIEKAGILNLRVAGNAGLMYQLRFAVRNDWPILRDILDKGLSSITNAERRDIRRRWVIVDGRNVLSRRFWIAFVAGLGVIILGIAGVIAWNRTLRKTVRQRTSQLQVELAERKRAEEALQVSYRFLEIANRHREMIPLLKEFTTEVRDLSGCAAVGIRILDEEGNIPYQAYEGFSRKFYESESPLSIRSDRCMCINVIEGSTDPTLPFYTEGGSFYMNGTTRFLATVSDKEKGQTRNVCNQSGFESVALVPIRSGDRILGLIHMADYQEDRVPLKMVKGMERAAIQLGAALQRVKAEEALRESEELLRITMENILDPIFLTDDDGRFIFVCPNIPLILGYTIDKIYDLGTISKFLGKDLVPLEKLKTLGEIRNIDCSLANKDGRLRDFLVNVKRVSIKGGTILYTFHDITERKQTEAQVERLKNYLSNIIDSMPAVLVGMDQENTVTQWNRQVERITGIPAAAAIGHTISSLLPDFTPWITAMRREVEKRRPAIVEKLLIEKEGERRFFDLMLYPLITNGVEGSVLRIEEVTEQARIQELMIQTEKMLSLGGLAAGMAHEINNPLGIITQAAQNIERRISPDLPANRQAAGELGLDLKKIQSYFEKRRITQFMESIREAAFRASRIISNMLQFSRQRDSTIQPGLLSMIVDRALELAGSDYDLKKKYDFKRIEIVRDYEEVPEIPMVAVEMEQVLLNLLKNAAQAMSTNPPERKPRIIIRLRRENRYALLEIEDNGPGMTEDIRRRVFEPFFTTKDPGIGTGLGLSVSYMIITQNHKGLMEVDSAPGRGTCFRVRLPLTKENNDDLSGQSTDP